MKQIKFHLPTKKKKSHVKTKLDMAYIKITLDYNMALAYGNGNRQKLVVVEEEMELKPKNTEYR